MTVSHIGYQVDLSDVRKTIAEIDEAMVLTDRELFDIGARAAFMIKMRTAKGIDFEGKPFEQYSESYADYRDDAGRNTSPVDLLFNGHMLAATYGFTDGEYAIVKVLGATEGRKAFWHNEGTKRMPKRRFLDLEDNGEEAFTLATMAAEMMARRINTL